jgi:replicative DNA helicase
VPYAPAAYIDYPEWDESWRAFGTTRRSVMTRGGRRARSGSPHSLPGELDHERTSVAVDFTKTRPEPPFDRKSPATKRCAGSAGLRHRRAGSRRRATTEPPALVMGKPLECSVFHKRAAQCESTLALDVMRSCSIKHGMASVIFSLEMSKSEIVMRLLSAEARIKLADMRAGRMSDDDWTRMARRMGGSLRPRSTSTTPRI